MSFSWKDYLTLAENLHTDPARSGPEEAAFRTATSRAYYAAFNCAFDFARGETYNPTGRAEDHNGVRRYFRERQSASDESRRISTLLDRIKDNRRQADYDQELKGSAKNLAYYTINTARQILEILEHL